MGWWSTFISSFRTQTEAAPEDVAAKLEEMKKAPTPTKRRAIARTMRPDEITQMLRQTMEHVEEQTVRATTFNGEIDFAGASAEEVAAFEAATTKILKPS